MLTLLALLVLPGSRLVDQSWPAPEQAALTPEPAVQTMPRVVPLRVVVPPLPRMWPGTTSPVDLVITNPNPHAVRVTGAELTVTRVARTTAEPDRPCPVSDFQTVAGRLDLELGPGESVSLSRHAVPPRQWPRLGLRNTDVNQDGCQRATVAVTARVHGVSR